MDEKPKAILAGLRDPKQRRSTLRLLKTYVANRPPETDPAFWAPIFAELEAITTQLVGERSPRHMLAIAELLVTLRRRDLDRIREALSEASFAARDGRL